MRAAMRIGRGCELMFGDVEEEEEKRRWRDVLVRKGQCASESASLHRS
jgi:hypothetical protein